MWGAIVTPEEFGSWFGVKLDGTPFTEGATVRGTITYPGYEHLTMEMVIERIEPEHVFAYRWHPAATDPGIDYSPEPMTLVEFRLDEGKGGTILRMSESGFDRIPAARRAEAFRMNEGGWTEQTKNIERHVTQP